MEPGGSMTYSQGLSNIFYPEPESAKFFILIPISLRLIVILPFHLRLGIYKGLFLVKILKALLPSFRARTTN